MGFNSGELGPNFRSIFAHHVPDGQKDTGSLQLEQIRTRIAPAIDGSSKPPPGPAEPQPSKIWGKFAKLLRTEWQMLDCFSHCVRRMLNLRRRFWSRSKALIPETNLPVFQIPAPLPPLEICCAVVFCGSGNLPAPSFCSVPLFPSGHSYTVARAKCRFLNLGSANVAPLFSFPSPTPKSLASRESRSLETSRLRLTLTLTLLPPLQSGSSQQEKEGGEIERKRWLCAGRTRGS